MRAALLAELRKQTSTRMWWVLLAGLAGFLVFLAAVIAFSFTVDPGTSGGPVLSGLDAATSVYSLINAVGYVFPLVIGSLTMTSEFRHGTVTQSLLVEPRRGVFLGAKLIGIVPFGLLYGVVGALAVVAGGAPVLATQGSGAHLGDGAVWRVLLLGVVVTAVWAVLGVALGSVLTNQVAAVVAVLAFTQLVEPIARLGLGAVDALAPAAAYLPGAAADGVIGASLFASYGEVHLLPAWGGALVLLGYVAVLAVVGRLTTLRRDIG